ncbi:hypothetical protein EV207_11362 [Scopulibacillus darangshiensis]|uniref:Uncharacterized protein n=1 Tax=Scopulibacillus darangshiensis TaxID=442528 RepID=A0A4R2P371_9BACL|nr:hypothetical protein EV207_11362 [Scopulibacillus darangshiensis]
MSAEIKKVESGAIAEFDRHLKFSTEEVWTL